MNDLDELIMRYPKLETARDQIQQSYEIMRTVFMSGGKMLVAGNGGSSADGEHIVGELMKGFVLPRKIDEKFAECIRQVDKDFGSVLTENLQQGLPTISLSGHASLNTAFLNDVDGELCFAQQVNGYGKPEDVLLCISTSGRAKNLVYAAITAKAKGMKVIGLTGGDGGLLKRYADITIIVNETQTYKVQEMHLPIYHTLCLMLEQYFFGQQGE